MKSLRICLAMLLIVSIFAGCSKRSGDVTVSSLPASSMPSPEGSIQSNIEQFSTSMEENADRMENELESALDLPPVEGSINSSEYSKLEESATTMSTDFSEIGALSSEKLGWGSGGPTDDVGRPNGATLYQNKYGEYSPFFIAPDNQKVYLTFDEGYENGYTPIILDTLKEKEVSAVFFITMDFAKKQPELVKRMIDEGHILGNHSTKHLSFPDMPMQEAAKDIELLHNYVVANYGYTMTLFRPPMGEFSEQTLAITQSLGYKCVFWSFAYKDYIVNDQPLTIVALDTITKKCHPGAIYLLHAVSKTNAEVLPDAIDNIRSLGFNISKWDMY